MTVFRTLSKIDRTWTNAWMDYMERLDAQAQGMFVNGVRSPKYNKQQQSDVMTNKKFTSWCSSHMHLFAADKI